MAPKGSKITPNGSKVGPKCSRLRQSPLKKHSIRLIIPHSVYFRRSRAMNTLREPFGDLPKLRSTLRGHSFTLRVALKSLGRAKTGSIWAFFGPSNATIVLNFRPKGVKIGKMGRNVVQTAKNPVKRGQNCFKRVKIASKWLLRLQKCFKWLKMGSKAFNWPKPPSTGSQWTQWPSTGPKSVKLAWLKMAFNWLKMAFNRPKSPSTGSKWLQ